MKNAAVDYGVSLTAVAAAVVVRLLLDPLLGDELPFITLFFGVAFAGWYGRRGAGVLALVLSIIPAIYLCLRSRDSFSLGVKVSLVLYALVSVALVLLIESLKEAQSRAEEKQRQLENEITIRRETEQRLASTTERFRLATEALNGIIFEWELSSGKVERTRGLAEVLGYQVEEAPGTAQWWWEQVHPEDRAATHQAFDEAMQSGCHAVCEYRVRHKDGRWLHVLDRALVLRDAEGQPIRVVGCTLDISDRKHAEQTLRFQLDLTRSITDNATTAIFMMDDRSRCTFMNPAAERMTGFRFEEVQGGILHDFIHHHHPDGRPYPMPECPIDRALPEQFDVVEHEDVFIRKSGEFFPVMVNARPIRKEGRAIGTVIEVRDVTQQKQAAEAARKRSEQVRLLAEVATRLNAAPDVASVVRVVTEEARSLIGAHQSVTSFTLDHNWKQAINAVSLSDRYAAWQDYDEQPDGSGIYSLVCRTNQPIRLTQAELEAHPDYRHFGKHASKHPPLRGWLAAPLVHRNGQNMGLIQLSDKVEGDFTEEDEAVLVQLTAMASVAIENARLVEDLREGDRRKDEFLATLAHELRNPLAPLRNSLELIKRASGNPTLLEQAHATMERQLLHMVRLIDDLLDVSRISRNKLELRMERVELASVVQHAVETCRPHVQRGGHALHLQLPSEPIVLLADSARLAQVIGNLLTNSCKYMKPGGHIWLSAQRQGDEVVLSVKDAGLGIAPEMLPRVFDLFTQGDCSLERAEGGLGIGLSLVKRLVEMHGGTVTAHSAGLGQGSEFIVRLPGSAQRPTEISRPRSGSEPTPPARRILIVDDNRDSASSLAILLRLTGNETRVAHDGVDGVAMAGEFRPDVILLDLGMPRMNGYEACRSIRKQPWGQDILILAQTGWGQEEDRRKSREAGFDGHLVKPVDHAVLLKLLSEWKPQKS